VCARWGNTLIVASQKHSERQVVDYRLAGMYRKTRPLYRRWVEVLE
jgi:hypothetical protein